MRTTTRKTTRAGRRGLGEYLLSAVLDLHETGVLTERQHHELTVEGEHCRATLLWIDSQLGHVNVVIVSLLRRQHHQHFLRQPDEP